ncbi:protein CreA [Methylomarinum sp. Ch1-1]|uniref:Protein CreA n=1 Tax=Methylomarinum roseum TaxID=3067653 RepID=A0AAU7NYL1_9GAMM|nr:protein CreA [Methylomarinum sp. Ch1-1]MDP4521806.1 protein CreA [Methylomarinum sp. Ch1-1]
MRNVKQIISIAGLSLVCAAAGAETVGHVDTHFKLIGPDDKIVVEAFDDPGVPGVTCYLSRAKTGGLSGAVGMAEDTSDASISCHQTGPIDLDPEIKSGEREGEHVFKKRTSLVFKSMQVVRFYDQKRHTLVYLVYSDRVVEGSPKNSVAAVPVIPWR